MRYFKGLLFVFLVVLVLFTVLAILFYKNTCHVTKAMRECQSQRQSKNPNNNELMSSSDTTNDNGSSYFSDSLNLSQNMQSSTLARNSNSGLTR